MASRCHVQGLLQESTIHTSQSILIRAMDANDKEQTEGGDQVSVSLQKPDGTADDVPVQDTDDGLYTTTFTPESAGQFKLEIKVFGRPIDGSPFQLNVTQEKDRVAHDQDFAVVEYPVALVGHEHCSCISVDLSKNSDEARVDRLQCEVVTQTGDNVACKVKRHDGGRFTVSYIPPIEGALSLHIELNGAALNDSPYTINVSPASPKATRIDFDQPIVINQVWSINIEPRDYRQQKIQVPCAAIALDITDLSTEKTFHFTPTKQSDDDLYVVRFVPETGPYMLRVSLYNIPAFTEHVEVKTHLPFTFQQHFPTSIASAPISRNQQQDLFFSSDTMNGKLYAVTSLGSVEHSINLPKTTETSQIAVDNRGRLVLLFPQSKSIHFLDPLGNELNRWQCHRKNSKPVTLTCTNDGRIVVADAKDKPSMFIYKSDGICLAKETLPPKSIVDGVNNICVDSRNRIVLAHHSEPTIHLYDSDGKPVLQFDSGASSVQLAAAVIAGNLLLVSQPGQVRIFRLPVALATPPETLIHFIEAVPIVTGHIFTSLAVTNDGCFIGLDVGQKQMVKYGCKSPAAPDTGH